MISEMQFCIFPAVLILTAAADALNLWDLCPRSTVFLIVRDTRLQFDDLPVKAAGLFTRYCFNQVRTVPGSTSGLVDDLPPPHLKACGMNRNLINSSSAVLLCDHPFFFF